MKKTIAVMMLLAGGLLAAPHVRARVEFGAPAPIAVVRPACPGPGYTWVNGYYASDGDFVAGYWAPPVERIAPVERFGRPDFQVVNRADRGRFDRDRR